MAFGKRRWRLRAQQGAAKSRPSADRDGDASRQVPTRPSISRPAISSRPWLIADMSEIRLAFKAGRAFRRAGTNFVDPDATKGAIILQNGEDGLLHFIWKNRSTNVTDEVSNVTVACW